MTAAPSLFTRETDRSAAREQPPAAASLVDLLYDGFHMLILLRHNKTPKDAERFAKQIEKFLAGFEHEAAKRGYASDDIYAAKYAFCATVDEAVLASRMAIRENWERSPLQLRLFGDQLAGEHFFDRLEQARNRGREAVAALEVFHMCMMLGFHGKYLLEGPERLKYLTAQLGEQIAHLRGTRAQFAPHWAPPDRIAHVLRREIPVWVVFALAGCLALLAYSGLEFDAQRATRTSLEAFNEIVQLPPRAPYVSISLP